MTSLFDRFGFDRVEIKEVLAKHGIQIDADGEAVDHAPVQSFPEWKQTMSLHPLLSVKDAAHAFAGIDKYSPGYLSEDEHAELSRWADLIDAAIASGELVAIQKSPDPDGSENWAIKPADLSAWCSSKAIPFPLPTSVAIPSTDAGLRNALAANEQDLVHWKMKAESLERSAKRCEELQREVDVLRKELREKSGTISRLTTEQATLKSDILDSRQKTTALKIIGGMAIGAYGINIHDSRLSGIGEIVSDLERTGAGVVDKTLRTYLREAAEIIEPPKKN